MKFFKKIITIIGFLILAVVVVNIIRFNNIQDDVYINHSSDNFVQIDIQEKAEEETILCFGERTFHQFDENDTGGYGYSMLVLDISNQKSIQGYTQYYPYGTDSNVGSITGSYSQEENVIRAQVSAYGEGMTYTDSRIWKLTDDELISGYTLSQLGGVYEAYEDLDDVIWNSDYPEKKVSCDQIDKWTSELYTQWDGYYQESDKDRLNLVLGNSETEIVTDFTERYIDIDSNWETEETLFYIEDENYCGTQGCTLLIVDKENKIMNRFDNVQKPVYVSVYREEHQWKDIVFWGNGSYRLLQFDGYSHSLKPSVAPVLSERDVLWHPEKYYLVLN